jgi:hypothetical protein
MGKCLRKFGAAASSLQASEAATLGRVRADSDAVLGHCECRVQLCKAGQAQSAGSLCAFANPALCSHREGGIGACWLRASRRETHSRDLSRVTGSVRQRLRIKCNKQTCFNISNSEGSAE